MSIQLCNTFSSPDPTDLETVRALPYRVSEEEAFGTPRLPWKRVGVYVREGTQGPATTIDRTDIKGKAVVVGKYLISIPHSYLRESTM